MSFFKLGLASALAGFCVLAAVSAPTAASAHGYVSFGFGLPFYSAPAYAPPPVYYAPRPVYEYQPTDWRYQEYRRHEWERRRYEEERYHREHGYNGW